MIWEGERVARRIFMPVQSVFCHVFPTAKPGPRLEVLRPCPGFLTDRNVTLYYFQFEEVVSVP